MDAKRSRHAPPAAAIRANGSGGAVITAAWRRSPPPRADSEPMAVTAPGSPAAGAGGAGAGAVASATAVAPYNPDAVDMVRASHQEGETVAVPGEDGEGTCECHHDRRRWVRCAGGRLAVVTRGR